MWRLFAAASIGNHEGLIRGIVLLDGFNINMKNEEGNTLLHCAIKHSPCGGGRKRKTVLELMDWDADPYIKDKDGKSCFDLLKEKISNNNEDSDLWISEEHRNIFRKMDKHIVKCNYGVEALKKKLSNEEDIAQDFLKKVYKLKKFNPNRLSFRIDTIPKVDKAFLDEIYEDIYKELNDIDSKNSLDKLYQNVCEELKETSEITIHKLRTVVGENKPKTKIGLTVANSIYNTVCRERENTVNDPPKIGMCTLQELSLQAVGKFLER